MTADCRGTSAREYYAHESIATFTIFPVTLRNDKNRRVRHANLDIAVVNSLRVR